VDWRTAPYPRDLVGYGRNPPHANWPGPAPAWPCSSCSTTRKAARTACCTAMPAASSSCPRSSTRPAYPDRHLSMEASTSTARASACGASCASSSAAACRSRCSAWHGAAAPPRAHRRLRRARPRDRLPRLALDPLPERRRGHRARAHAHRHGDHREAHRPARRWAGTPAATAPTRAAWWPTRRLLYDSDYYGDDLPFWTAGEEDRRQRVAPHLVVPYTLDTNDMRFACRRASPTATSSSPTCATPSTCCTPRAKSAPDDERRHALPPARPPRPLPRAAALPRPHRKARPRVGLPPRGHRAPLGAAKKGWRSSARGRRPATSTAREGRGASPCDAAPSTIAAAMAPWLNPRSAAPGWARSAAATTSSARSHPA
jgi:allantoinase